MAKLGQEIEGKRHYGKRTMFISAEELFDNSETIVERVHDEAVDQLYISDHNGFVNLEVVEEMFLGAIQNGLAVTVELTRVPEYELPVDIDIMLNITNGTSIDQLNALRYHDEVKVSVVQEVYCWTMDDAVRTFAHEFEKDVEITL